MWRSDNAKAVKNMLGVECKNYIKMKGSSIITAVLSFVIIVFLVFSLKADLLTVGLFISLSNQLLDYTMSIQVKYFQLFFSICHILF